MPSSSNKRTSIIGLYLCTAVFIIASVILFALFYSGSGAEPLRDASSAFEEAMQSEKGMDILATPAPTPTPVPVSLTGRIIPYYENGLWGYKNTECQIVFSPRFEDAWEFENGVAFAKQDGVYGLLSVNDVWLADPQWTQALPFSEGYAAVEKDGKWGYIDAKGNISIDYKYREAGSFHCGRAMARTGSAYGYIDVFGNVAVSAKWRKAGDFSQDLAFAISDEYERDRAYIIDKVGEKVATLGTALRGSMFSENFAVVADHDTTYYYMNTLGKSAFQITFSDAKAFSEGLAAVKTEEGWGYINNLGSFVIPAQYAQAENFSEGLAAVLDRTSGKWGFVDKKGNVVIEPSYDSADAFLDGFSIVTIGSDRYLVDQSGKERLFYTK